MAIDKKYGHVTLERGDVGDKEPVIVCRAADKLLPELLEEYAELCEANGSPQFHVDLVEQNRAWIAAWQQEHPDLVRVPASAGYQASLDAGPDAST